MHKLWDPEDISSSPLPLPQWYITLTSISPNATANYCSFKMSIVLQKVRTNALLNECVNALSARALSGKVLKGAFVLRAIV